MTQIVDFGRRLEYDRYMRSPEWQTKRAERILMDGGKCVRCGSSTQLQVHHRNYDRFGDGSELMSDLETLCKPCHRKEHGRDPVKGSKSAAQKRREHHQWIYHQFLKGAARMEEGLVTLTSTAKALSDDYDGTLEEIKRLTQWVFESVERDSRRKGWT